MSLSVNTNVPSLTAQQGLEGAMNESTAILQRMRDLAVQSANDSNNSADRAALQKDPSFQNDWGLGATYAAHGITITNTTGNAIAVKGSGDNGTNTLRINVTGKNADCSVAGKVPGKDAVAAVVSVKGQVKFLAEDGEATYSVATNATTGATSVLGTAKTMAGSVDTTKETRDTVSTVNISSYTGAQKAIGIINAAIADIDDQRGNLGAIQNRFQHTIFNLQSIRENMTASRRRVKDTDYAAEMAEMTKQQILKQASIANLAQANDLARDVLHLLK